MYIFLFSDLWKDSWLLVTKSLHVFSHNERIFVDRVSAASIEQTRHTCL